MSPGTFFMPPDRPDLGGKVTPHAPLVFLAGPIKSGPDWQTDAARIIQARDPRINVANPRRPITFDGEFTDSMWDEQNDWEHRYLDYAAAYGVTLFWLANEEEHRCDRAYAQTTRFECGMTMFRSRIMGSRMVVGIDTAFSGAKYIRRTCAKYAPDVTFHDTLEATCLKAVELIGALYPVDPGAVFGG